MVFQYVLYITSKKIYVYLPLPQLWQKFASNCILVPHFIQNIFSFFNNSLTAKQKNIFHIIQFHLCNKFTLREIFRGQSFTTKPPLLPDKKKMKRADPARRQDIPTFSYTAFYLIFCLVNNTKMALGEAFYLIEKIFMHVFFS